MTIEPYNYNDEPSGRVDTLAMALDKCEKLEKQLNIAKEALHLYKNLRGDGTLTNYPCIAINALEEIGCLEIDYKELEKC